MGEVSREQLTAMTDQELLAYERERHGDPYMSLLRAKGMGRVVLQCWHAGMPRTKADRAAEAEARRRLLQKLFPFDSAVLESKRWSRPERRHDGGSFPRPRLLGGRVLQHRLVAHHGRTLRDD